MASNRFPKTRDVSARSLLQLGVPQGSNVFAVIQMHAYTLGVPDIFWNDLTTLVFRVNHDFSNILANSLKSL